MSILSMKNCTPSSALQHTVTAADQPGSWGGQHRVCEECGHLQPTLASLDTYTPSMTIIQKWMRCAECDASLVVIRGNNYF